MKQEIFESIFSKERIHKYYATFPNNVDKAILLYLNNIKLSESLYPLLAITEISVRNAINHTMSNYFNTSLWFDELIIFDDLNRDVVSAKNNLHRRKEVINCGKLTAELTFGFWTKLFNAKYEQTLWKPLRLSFPNMPKYKRKRNNISKPMNSIRNLRNRVYHYEPIIWNLKVLEDILGECYEILSWIDPELPIFTKSIDDSFTRINIIKNLYC